MPDRLEEPPDLPRGQDDAREPPELLLHLRPRHRVAGSAAGGPDDLVEHAAVAQPDPHPGLGNAEREIGHRPDPAGELDERRLGRRRELRLRGLAAGQRERRAVGGAELRLEPGARLCNRRDLDRERMHVALHGGDRLGGRRRAGPDRAAGVDRRVEQVAGGIELRAVVEDLEARAEVLHRRAQVGDAEERAGQAGARVEDAGGSGEALAREQRRQESVHRRLAGVERLAHGSERLLEPRGLGARDPERSPELLSGETQQPPRGGRRAEVTEDRGDVPSAIGEHRPNDAADPRLDLEAGDERLEGGGPRPVVPFGHREHDRGHRRRAVDDGGQVRVVEVERVALRAVGERGQQRARPATAAEDRRLRLAAGDGDHRVERGRKRLGRPADGCADPVGEGEAGGGDHRVGQRLELEPEDEVDQRVRDGGA